MYLFILSIIISIIIGIIFLCIECYHRTDLRLLDKIEHFFFSFICGITITNIVFTLGSLMYIGIKGIEKNPIINNTFPIVAFEASTETQGVFIFGSGTIGAEQSFYYIEETSKGKQIKTILNDDTVFIKEDNNVSPNISTLQSYTVLPEKYKKWCYIHGFYGNQYTVITIPENSIKYEYNLDLQKLK